jgi:hypothetical protein
LQYLAIWHGRYGKNKSCDGTGILTIEFSEHNKRDKNGRFISPYKVWNDLKKKRERNKHGIL